jgi:hypothetical protein
MNKSIRQSGSGRRRSAGVAPKSELMNGSDNSSHARHGRGRARALPAASPHAAAGATVRAEPGCHSGRIAVRALLLLLVAAVAAVPVPSLAADEPAASELQATAAFLINFPKYVTWPQEAFADTNSPVVVDLVRGKTE